MISFPNNRKEVENRARADVKSQLTTSNPWLKNSFLGALITGYAGRVYEYYLQLKNALLEMFPDTASGSYLERWGSYVSVTRNPSTQAEGYVVFTGTAGSAIASGSTLTNSDGDVYTTQAAATITATTVSITSLTRSGTTATANTSSAHLFATGMTVTIAGANETAYNGDVEIVVTDADTFTYTVSGSPSTPATGTITASADFAYVLVQSEDYGLSLNQESGTPLSLATPIAGVDSTAYVAFDEIGNGSDAESDEEYRTRVLYRYQNPISLFNVSAIKIKAFERTGVTRVWVFEAGTDRDAISVSGITRSGSIATATTATNHYLEDGQYVTVAGASQSGYNITAKVIVMSDTTFAYVVDSTTVTPATGTITAAPTIPAGQVKIYFMRDNDGNPIPTSAEVTIVKDQILTIKPAHVSDSDVVVNSPTAVPVNFTFTALSPSTTAMRTAITNSLTELFKNEVNVSETLQAAAYTAAIWQTVDETGALVRSFTLSSPSGSVTINEGEVPTLGTITFS